MGHKTIEMKENKYIVEVVGEKVHVSKCVFYDMKFITTEDKIYLAIKMIEEIENSMDDAHKKIINNLEKIRQEMEDE